MDMSLGDLSERELIKMLLEVLGRDERELLGYDDVSAIRMGELILAVKTDMFVESADKLPGMRPLSIGWKSLVMNVSDFAAKGIRPLGGLVGLGTPPELSLSDLLEVYEGISRASSEYGVRIWGGDTSSARELIVSVSLVGLGRRVLPRCGAEPGEVLVATGDFGYTSLAFKVLIEGVEIGDEELVKEALSRVYFPRVALDFGVRLAERDLATAGIDSSDGLAVSRHESASASRVRIVLDGLPAPEGLLEALESAGVDPVRAVLYEGGEEFVSIYAIRRDVLSEVLDLAREERVDLRILGSVEEGAGVYLRLGGERIPVEVRGWDHLRGWSSTDIAE